MIARETTLSSLFDGQKLYRIPLFQRTYTWDKRNWKALWQDIIETAAGPEHAGHFMGSIVTKSLPSTPEGVQPFLVIDGQQRLITLSVMLAALRDCFRLSDPQLAEIIDGLYLRNRFVDPDEVFKVLPTQGDRSAYFRVLSGDRSGIASKVASAYDYFRNEAEGIVSKFQELTPGALAQLVVKRLEFVSITLEPSDDEYRIFESLNGKGERLTQSDLIRNYIFMRIPHNEQDRVHGDLWMPMQSDLNDQLEMFFRHVLLASGQFVRLGDVYRSWKDALCMKDSSSLIEELQKLLVDSGRFARLIEPSREENEEIRSGLSRLNRWGAETIYPKKSSWALPMVG